MQLYNKAIAAVLVPAILMGLEYFGITSEMTIHEAVPVLLTALAVYWVPNKK